MNKNIITYAAIAFISVIPTVTFAIDGSPLPVAASVSTVTLSSASSASTVLPSTADSASTVPPSTSGSASTVPPSTASSVSTVPSSTGGSSPDPIVTPTQSQSSSGSSSGSSGGGRAYIQNCLITGYMSFGANNDAKEVTKLQNFLKNYEKLDVNVNGTFDTKTLAAVKTFQNKYSAVILTPWGLTEATGNVYMTTIKKVNQIACFQPLTLNPAELALINGRKNVGVKQNQPTVTVTNDISTNDSETSINSDDEGSNVGSITIDNSNDDELSDSKNTASVGKASILGRFWNFIVYLFK